MISPGRGLLSRLTDLCLRHRRLVVLAWVPVVVLGVAGSLRLGPLLTTGFSLPSTDSARVNPSTTALVGRWNEYLPAWTAPALRVKP
jgi:uncharacterized protein involved in exopolysaccharide biosynthesis